MVAREQFLTACVQALRSPEDLEPMAEHLASTLQLLALNRVLGQR